MRRLSQLASVGLFAVLAPTASAAITEGLAGYWAFDETVGSTAADGSGQARNGNLMNMPTDGSQWESGQIGGSLHFRGPGFGDYVNVPDFTHPTTTMTLSAWVRADTAPAWATIANNFASVSGPFYFGMLGAYGNLSVYLTDASGTSVYNGSNPATLSLHAWHHVAFVADGTRIRIWSDGRFVQSFFYGGTIMTMPSRPQLEIGGTTTFNPNQGYWNGNIDDLGLWTRALSPSELLAVYNAGLAGNPFIAVPEPSVVPLLCLGLMGLTYVRWQRRLKIERVRAAA